MQVARCDCCATASASALPAIKSQARCGQRMTPSLLLGGLALVEAFSTYLSYGEIGTWYQALARSRPGQVQYSTIGTTHEGRDLACVTFGNGTEGVAYVQGLVHAREWATGPILAHVVEHLLGDALLRRLQVVVVPVANPDGYEYSRTMDRLWRKNRAPVAGGIGVDLNRNFPARWEDAADGLLPESEIFRGESAGCEAEVQAIMRHLDPLRVRAVMDLHGYGKRILGLPAHATADTPALNRTKRIGEEMARLIVTPGLPFSAMPIAAFAPSTGSLVEWAHQQKGALSYGVEVAPSLVEQPDVTVGFFPDPSTLRLRAAELMPAIRHFLAAALDPTQSP